jgi:hypothetical protein
MLVVPTPGIITAILVSSRNKEGIASPESGSNSALVTFFSSPSPWLSCGWMATIQSETDSWPFKTTVVGSRFSGKKTRPGDRQSDDFQSKSKMEKEHPGEEILGGYKS